MYSCSIVSFMTEVLSFMSCIPLMTLIFHFSKFFNFRIPLLCFFIAYISVYFVSSTYFIFSTCFCLFVLSSIPKRKFLWFHYFISLQRWHGSQYWMYGLVLACHYSLINWQNNISLAGCQEEYETKWVTWTDSMGKTACNRRVWKRRVAVINVWKFGRLKSYRSSWRPGPLVSCILEAVWGTLGD